MPGTITRAGVADAIRAALEAVFDAPPAAAEPAWDGASAAIANGIIDGIIAAIASGDYLRSDGTDLIGDPGAGGGGVTDHGALTGLGDDDHTQYALAGAAGSSRLTMLSNRLLGRWSASTGALEQITIGSGLTLDVSGDLHVAASSIDHGALTGLGDDDHTQYALAGAVATSRLTQITNRILGRTTASTGAPELIEVVSPLSFAALQLGLNENALVLWNLERDIDCSAEASNDWNAGGDGNYSLGGLTWAIVNTGVADTFGPDGSTGVRFNASANATVFNNGTRSATHIYIAATTLIPNFDPLADYVIEFGFSSLTLGSSDDQVSCFFWNTNGNRTLRAGRRNSSGSHQTFALLDTNQNGTTGYTDTAFALKINAGAAMIASGAFTAGAFPTLYPHLGSQVALNGTSPIQSPIFDPPNLRIGFAWCSNAAGNADSTLARIRVWRRRGLFG